MADHVEINRIMDAIDDVMIGRGWNEPLSEIELAQVKRILRDAGVEEQHIAWMAASCPSVRQARRYYPARKAP